MRVGSSAGVRSTGFVGANRVTSGRVGQLGFVGVNRFTPGLATRPGFVGERFNRFNRNRFFNRRGFNNFVVAGGGYGYYPYYPYYYNNGGYSYDPNAANNGYATDNSASLPPVAEQQCPDLVAGDIVGNVQRVLRYRGFYRGPIDGLSGPTTRAAIRAYDASVGLPPTGVIDARLLTSMQLM